MNKGFLLDTDVLIAYLRGYPQTVSLLKAFAKEEATFSISAVTVIEIEAGIRDKERERTYELLDILEVLLLDKRVAQLAGSLLRKYRSKGISLGLADVIIGATAVAEDLILITYNPRHYPMSEIKIFSQ
jgi:predicted nucleic acid-binding protein